MRAASHAGGPARQNPVSGPQIIILEGVPAVVARAPALILVVRPPDVSVHLMCRLAALVVKDSELDQIRSLLDR